MGQLHAVLRYISGGVSDWNFSILAAGDVLAHVTGGGLDVWGSLGSVDLVIDHLVAREEGHGVIVLDELVDGGEDALEVLVIVRGRWIILVDRIERVVDIDNEVDAGISQSLHAHIV